MGEPPRKSAFYHLPNFDTVFIEWLNSRGYVVRDYGGGHIHAGVREYGYLELDVNYVTGKVYVEGVPEETLRGLKPMVAQYFDLSDPELFSKLEFLFPVLGSHTVSTGECRRGFLPRLRAWAARLMS